MSVAQKANKSIELLIKETFCCRGFSSWVTWYFEEITVKVSVCWTPSSYLSLTSHFNVTPLWFPVPLTLPRYTYTSQQLSLILRKKISRERPETTQKKTKGPKCHTLAVWGRRWRRWDHTWKRGSCPTLWKRDPLDIYFKHPVMPGCLLREAVLSFMKAFTHSDRSTHVTVFWI